MTARLCEAPTPGLPRRGGGGSRPPAPGLAPQPAAFRLESPAVGAGSKSATWNPTLGSCDSGPAARWRRGGAGRGAGWSPLPSLQALPPVRARRCGRSEGPLRSPPARPERAGLLPPAQRANSLPPWPWGALPPRPAPPQTAPSSPPLPSLRRRALFLLPLPAPKERLWSPPPPPATLLKPFAILQGPQVGAAADGVRYPYFWGSLHP